MPVSKGKRQHRKLKSRERAVQRPSVEVIGFVPASIDVEAVLAWMQDQCPVCRDGQAHPVA